MNAQIEKTIKDIIAETETILKKSDLAKAGITPENFEALKQIISDGYTTPELEKIINDKDIQNKIHSDKIYDIYFDKMTVEVLKTYLTRNGSIPNSAKQIDTGEPKIHSVKVNFRQDCIDGIVLLGNNAVAIYRRGLQLPSVIYCHSAEEANKLYEDIKGAM